jgi:transcriptional regulator with GAF, ATPase, and Fis domain
MRPREDELTGTQKHAFLNAGRPHVVAMWPGGTIAKELPEHGKLTVGRSRTCDLTIDHGSVSREHVAFHDGRPVEVEDLGSTNGTTVGGVRIPSGTRVAIERGQVVVVGAAVLVVHGAFEPQVPAPAPRRPSPPARPDEPPIIVADEAMRELHRIVDLVAKGDLSVVLLGETGTGKDVLADALHRRSPRAAAAYVRLNCAALPDALLESELFGYERGAFTGAVQAKPGLLEIADGGSMFLDEVAELPLTVQAKLLRVLENGEITRVGGLRSRKVEVRIICATNRDLSAAVRTGTFRQDLFFRLNGITLTIPPLRSRRSEIAPLAREFVREICRHAGRPTLPISDEAFAFLESQSWPGNVRELRNAIERAVTLCTDDRIEIRHLASIDGGFSTQQTTLVDDRATTPLLSAPPSLPNLPEPSDAPTDVGLQEDARRAARALERRRIAEAMDRCGGNQTRAAQLLQISRRTLVARLTEYGFARPLKDRRSGQQ